MALQGSCGSRAASDHGAPQGRYAKSFSPANKHGYSRSAWL